MTFASPGAWYVSSVAYAALAAWTATHSYAAGTLVRQTSAAGNERVFICTIAGTSNGTEPTWVITKGAKTTDNTVTWMEVTGTPGLNGDLTHTPAWVASSAAAQGLVFYDTTSAALQICSAAGTSTSSIPTFSATAGVTTTDGTATWTSLGAASGFAVWAAPSARGAAMFASGWGVAGADFYFADNHAETQATSITWNPPGLQTTSPCRLISIDHTVTTAPPTGVKSGASVTGTTATPSITLGNATSSQNYYYGFTFTTGGNNLIFLGSSDTTAIGVFDTCTFAPGSGANVTMGGSGTTGIVNWNNCNLVTASAGQSINMGGVAFSWRGGAVSGVSIASLFVAGSTAPCDILVEGVDFSAIVYSSGAIAHAGGCGYMLIKDCKLPSATAGAASGSTGTFTVDLTRSDNSTASYRLETHNSQGNTTTSTTVVRSSGASDGVTAYSHAVVTNAGAQWYLPFQSIPVIEYNTVTGTNRVVTMYGIANAAALPNNDDVWMDAEYLGSGTTLLGSYGLESKASALATGSALTADPGPSAWDTAASARANSTLYSLGAIMKVASNSGRIFFCTVSGTSAASEPGGLATAIDGGTVVDGAATWRAGVRFKLALTLSSPQPGMVGYIYAYPKIAKQSFTVFLDPLITLS